MYCVAANVSFIIIARQFISQVATWQKDICHRLNDSVYTNTDTMLSKHHQ